MNPDRELVGERLVTLGNPKTLIISKTMLPFNLEMNENIYSILGLLQDRIEKLVLRDLVYRQTEDSGIRSTARNSLLHKFIGPHN